MLAPSRSPTPTLVCACVSFSVFSFLSPSTLYSPFLFLSSFLFFFSSLFSLLSLPLPPSSPTMLAERFCPVDDILYFQYSSLWWGGAGEATLYRLRDNIVPTVRAFVSSLMGRPKTPSPISLAISSSSSMNVYRERNEIDVKIRLLVLYLQATAGNFTINPVWWLIWKKDKRFLSFESVFFYSLTALCK